jgi:hypothetical protein
MGGFRLPNGDYVAALACFVTAGDACRTSTDPIGLAPGRSEFDESLWAVTLASGTSLLRIPLTLVNPLTELAARLRWNFAARTPGHSLWECRVPSPKAVGNSGQGEAFK